MDNDPRYHHDIPVRYGDLDAQGHLNNARFFTYIEHARILYLRDLGLWNGQSFLDLGLIVADAHIAYHAPVHYGQTVRVGVRAERIGNKSIRFTYRLTDAQTGSLFATGDTVMVAFDYHTNQAIPVPDHWRETIRRFEGLAE